MLADWTRGETLKRRRGLLFRGPKMDFKRYTPSPP
jgi:hypothetical protein